jgi:ABC-type nitrate/sulfonate/bicarbonate transport system substrate-binding protein
MDHIKFSMVAPAFPYYPVWVAEERRYFDRYGIRSEIEITGATDKVTTSLAEGNAQIGMATPEGIIGNAARGGRLRLIAGNANRAPLSLIGLKSIKEIAGLKGKKVGTSSLKEGTAILVRRMLEAHGLEYPVDYEFAIEPLVLFTVAFKDNSAAVVFAEEIKQSLDNNTDVSAVTLP